VDNWGGRRPKLFEDEGFNDQEFYVTGRAMPEGDAGLPQRISAAVGDKPESFRTESPRFLIGEAGSTVLGPAS
jgi:hypothetical protein